MDTTHPQSLRTFFATEMWERYGFYVVQTLLALFLSLQFKWPDKQVYALVGSFTALTYVSPVIGGWIADHLIGQKRSVLIGAVILFFCYLGLAWVAFSSSANHANLSTFGLMSTLAGIAMGTGLLKPNISSLLGNEYPEHSPKRESGFTIFYMGITSGIILGSTLPGILTYHFGWPSSFISAALGMIIAIAVFAFGVHRYQIADYHPYTFNLQKSLIAVVMMMAIWVVSFYILRYPALADSVFIGIVLASIAYFIYATQKEPSIEQARQLWVIGLLCIISIMFWALYFQMFLSLTLFIARVVKPTVFGIPFPPPYYVSLQSLGAIVFGVFLSRRKRNQAIQQGVQSGNQFVFSMFFMTIGYLLITLVCHLDMGTRLLSPFLIMPVYLIFSLAELFLYPVGLSAITVLSTRKRVSTMMGIFFVSLGVGGFLSGKLAFLTAVSSTELSMTALKAHYTQAFNQLMYILLAAMFVCFFINRLIKRLLCSQYKQPPTHQKL